MKHWKSAALLATSLVAGIALVLNFGRDPQPTYSNPSNPSLEERINKPTTKPLTIHQPTSFPKGPLSPLINKPERNYEQELAKIADFVDTQELPYDKKARDGSLPKDNVLTESEINSFLNFVNPNKEGSKEDLESLLDVISSWTTERNYKPADALYLLSLLKPHFNDANEDLENLESWLQNDQPFETHRYGEGIKNGEYGKQQGYFPTWSVSASKDDLPGYNQELHEYFARSSLLTKLRHGETEDGQNVRDSLDEEKREKYDAGLADLLLNRPEVEYSNNQIHYEFLTHIGLFLDNLPAEDNNLDDYLDRFEDSVKGYANNLMRSILNSTNPLVEKENWNYFEKANNALRTTSAFRQYLELNKHVVLDKDLLDEVRMTYDIIKEKVGDKIGSKR